ncbi:NAD(P)-dependent oxidoreductase [Aquiluna sp.]|nr:NAD(P)-dependent oxidoreductase [Aquiluna sp.]
MSPTQASVIGLGAMGSAIAQKLIDEGVNTQVFNRSKGPGQAFADQGVYVAKDLIEAFNSEVVFSMLSNDAAVLAVFTNELLAQVPAGVVHVNQATVSIAAAKELEKRHAQAGIHYVAGPVLGRPHLAPAAKLVTVAGGSDEAVAVIQPLVDKFCAKTFRVSTEPWVSSLVKIGVNYNLIHALQAMGESIALVENADVDPNLFIEILTFAAFTGTAYSGYGPMIANKNYQPAGFLMEMGLKDLSLVEGAAKDLGLKIPAAPMLRELFEIAMKDEALAQSDWSAVSEVTRRQIGL